MQVKLENLGKKFNNEWIFKNLNYTFSSKQSYAVTGSNGSGKSTLLSILSGFRLPDLGQVVYEVDGKRIDPTEVYKEVSVCGPHVENILEFTVDEAVAFHSKFKPWNQGLSNADILKLLDLPKKKGRFIKAFSSGMKQKLKLGLALFSQSPLLLLDEPTSNLDANNKAWYHKHVKDQIGKKTVIVFSNDPGEFDFTDQILDLTKFKLSN